MAEYSFEEAANELSQYFQGKYEPERENGIQNPNATHEQIMEIARLVFLLNNPSAFLYLARLIKNTAHSILLQETAIIEDMLIALDSLSEGVNNSGGLIGSVGPTELSNAETAVLALEAAGSVQNRPELDRFAKIIDRFTELTRVNVSSFDGDFVLPRGEARSILVINLDRLKGLHAGLLVVLESIVGLVDNFVLLDIPSQVSQNSLIRVRKKLVELQEIIEGADDEENITNSRGYLLRGVTAKVVTKLLQSFNNPDLTARKLCGDNNGTVAKGVVGEPSDGAGAGPPFTLQAAGEGTAASVLSSSGPWLLDTLSSGLLQVKIDGGPTQDIDLSQIQGPGLHGRNSAPFDDTQFRPIWPGIPGSPTDPPPPDPADYEQMSLLHITVDSNVYEFRSQTWYETIYNSDLWYKVKMQPPIKLGFKHIGSPLFFDLMEIDNEYIAPGPNQGAAPGVVTLGAGYGGWTIDGQDMAEDEDHWDDVDNKRWTHVYQPRVITDLSLLHSSVTLTYNSGTDTYTLSGANFQTWYDGFYVKTSTPERYEIIRVLSSSEAIIDTRTDTPGSAAGTVDIYGEPNNFTEVEFGPDLLYHTNGNLGHQVARRSDPGTPRGPFNVPDTALIKIGPAIKLAYVPSGGGADIATLITELNDVTNVPGIISNQPYAHAGYHIVFSEQDGYNSKVTLQGRSRLLPEEVAIADSFLHAKSVGKAQNTGVGPNSHFREWPGPYPLQIVEYSAHEVLGFDIQQAVDENLDPFLSVEELESISKDLIEGAGGEVEIVETDVFAGSLTTNPNSSTVTDTTADFTALGIGFGYLLEIEEGDAKKVYIIETNPSNDTLGVQIGGRGFVAREDGLSYRIFTRQLKISSATTGLGSSVEIVSAPTQVFPPPLSAQYGTAPAVEAVNSSGENLDMSGLEEGDQEEFSGKVVESVSDDGAQATVAGGVSTGFQGQAFCFQGGTEDLLRRLIETLTTILTSRNLMARHNFDENLDQLDAAMTPIVTPGQSFQANLNQAKRLLADLLSVLTASPNTDLYTTTVVPASLVVDTTLEAYSAPRVDALDSLLNSLEEYRFDRALSLLITGRLEDFFGTTAETASFSGSLLAATRTAREDLPQSSPLLHRVEQDLNSASGFVDTGVDAETDFSDSEDRQIVE